MLDHYSYYLKALDAAIAGTVRGQCTDENSSLYGSVEATAYGVAYAHAGIAVAGQLALGYFYRGCKYEGDRECLRRAIIAMEYALRLQNADGTLDLSTTNFHDGSETAFAVKTIAPVYLYLRERVTDDTDEKRLERLIYTFIDRAADGILCGGFHTPNHRWVHSAALALCYRVTGRSECLARMRLFLNEGIDCDENGEYTERSAGVYNHVCNKSLIYIAHYADMPELLCHVKRNLRMVLTYIEPDFTVNTMNSTRQDLGTGPDWKLYYSDCLYMALATGDAELASVADAMLKQLECAFGSADRGIYLYEYMPLTSADEMKMRLADTESEIRDYRQMTYSAFYENSGIVRMRAGECSLTLLKGSACFMKLQCGKHSVYMRAAGSFYSRGQFAADSIEKIDGGYRLSFSVRWGYKQPFTEAPDTSVWDEMDHSKRENVMMQDFIWTMDVYTADDGITLKTRTEGIERVPVKLEIMLDAGGIYENDSLLTIGAKGGYVYQKCDKSEYRYMDRQILMIEGGFFEHYSGHNMRGTLPADPNKFTVAFTAYTPVKKTIKIGWKMRN